MPQQICGSFRHSAEVKLFHNTNDSHSCSDFVLNESRSRFCNAVGQLVETFRILQILLHGKLIGYQTERKLKFGRGAME